ncbi:MAG: hypothetical protein AAGA58_12435 [Verrucomicrobiota bacterium]
MNYVASPSSVPFLADWTLSVDWASVIFTLLGAGMFFALILAIPLMLILWLFFRHGEPTSALEAAGGNLETEVGGGVQLSDLAKEAPRISPDVPNMPARRSPTKSTAAASAAKPAKKKAATKPKKKTSSKSTKSTSSRSAAKPAPKPKKKAAPKGTTLDPALGLIYKKKPKEIDDLQEISGVGPVLEKKLHKVGIYTFAQVAKWSDKMVGEFSERLSFRDRISRDNWRKQAAKLHKKKYGKSATR